jgi:sugar O-acyltransferase (sialic acid O-acetyltransferase NeuD family)
MEKLFIFPFNGNGVEALDCIDDKFDLVGFIDDLPQKHGVNEFGFEVFSRDILHQFPGCKLLLVPGSPDSFLKRDEYINSFNQFKVELIQLIHPTAKISPLAKIGQNVLIMAGVVITSNAIIGDHVCILPNSVIHHDTEIGKYTLIGSNVTVAGNTIIGEKCYIGSCSSIINNISIEDNCLIGIGSNVIKSVSAQSKIGFYTD